MIKTKTLGLLAVAMLAAASVYAGGKECCATKAKNGADAECSATFANLNLSVEQKAKIDGFQAKCKKDGCTKESTAQFLRSAKGVLSKEQFATLKSECGKMHEGSKA